MHCACSLISAAGGDSHLSEVEMPLLAAEDQMIILCRVSYTALASYKQCRVCSVAFLNLKKRLR